MGKNNRKAVLNNPASLNQNTIEDHSDCEACQEDYIFAMKDKYHEFSIGLRTILDCLELAEQEGAVPKLSEEWWIQVQNRYDQQSDGCI